VGTQEKDVQWIEDENWEYQTSFPMPEGPKHQHYTLQFDGLDTYAQVWLNGKLILESDNMFRQYKLEVGEQLQSENTLRIVFESPLRRHAERIADNGLPYHKTAGNDARPKSRVSVYTRKAPYQFGWDWGPRLVTSGIWQPVSLIGWDEVQLTGFHLFQNSVTAQQVSGVLEARFQGRLEPGMELRLVHAEDKSIWVRYPITERIRTAEQIPVRFDNLQLWWPHTLGKPHRYPLRLELWQGELLLGSQTQAIGFRSIELVQELDPIGTSYYFKGSGLTFYAMGANLVPPDPLPPRATDEVWQGVVADARAVGMNMLRAWGGGIYPPDAFYDACDSLGILVWQDFMFACSMYPDEEEFLASIQEEVIYQVERLQVHPSLALWCGNNEVDVAWHNWGWQIQFGIFGKDSARMADAYRHIFKEKIPRLIRVFDPNRNYVHTSPLSNWGKLENFNHSSMHYWGVWHGPDDFEKFSVYVPRFMSEYGFQSFPEVATVAQFANGDSWSLDDPVMSHHQKSYIGNGEIRKHLRRYYPKEVDFEDFLYKSQLTQAKAMEMAITAHRQRAGHNMGTLYWQINDTWPGPSWSSIDYYGRWKASHYKVRQLYQPVMASAILDKGSGNVWVHSTSPEIQDLQVVVTRHPLRGKAEQIVLDTTFTLSPFAAIESALSFEYPRSQRNSSVWEVTLWKGEQRLSSSVQMAVRPKRLRIPQGQVVLQHLPESQSIELTSSTFIPDVWLEADGVSHWSDNSFHLLPSQTVRIRYEGTLESEKEIRWRSWGVDNP